VGHKDLKESKMNIYRIKQLTERTVSSFKPTRLYIKELAGIKYFGKTTRQDAVKYPGSGKIWKDRIKKYGRKAIKTPWVSEWFYCPHQIQEFALKFSELNQIVESEEWANYKPENGLDGGCSSRSEESIEKERLTKSKNPYRHSEEIKENMRVLKSEEIKKNMKKAQILRRKTSEKDIWITDGINNLLVPKSNKIPNNWRHGRTTAQVPPAQKGKIWINDGIKSAMSNEIPNGWVRGRLYKRKLKEK